MSERDVTVYTDAIRDALENIPEEYAIKSERELRHIVKPTYQHYQLKNYFWDEMARATMGGRKMVAAKVYSNLGTRQYFYSKILKNKPLMAWISSPIVEYENKAKAALDKISERYEELIEMEITTTKRIKGEDGEYELVTETDPKKALVLLQTIKNLEERVKGSSIQRQVSVTASAPDAAGGETVALSMDTVDEKLRALEKKINPYGDKENVHDKERSDTGQPEDGVPEKSEGFIVAESKRVEQVD